LTNAVLLLVGVLACVFCVVMARTRNPANWSPAAMAFTFMIVALFGPSLWTWSRYSGGAGLPDTVDSSTPLDSAATPPLVWATVGAAVATLLVPAAQVTADKYFLGRTHAGLTPDLPVARNSDGERTTVRARANENGSSGARFMLVAMVVTYGVWLLGQGPSVLNRVEYLQTDGEPTLLRATYPAGVVLALAALWLASNDRSTIVRWATYAMAVVWFVSLSSVGTRTAVAFPLLFAVIMIRKGTARNRLNAGALIIGCVAAVAVVITFGVTQDARQYPHGLLNYWSLLTGVLDGNALTTTLQRLTSSIFAAHPIIERSALTQVDPSFLIANANPIPGTAQPPELERLWPYEWVPLAFVGTWYSALGTLAQVFLFGSMAYSCGITMHNLRLGRLQAASILPVGLAVLMALLSIQYPSRMVFRIFSIAVMLAVLSYLVRSRRSRGADVVTRREPQEALAAR